VRFALQVVSPARTLLTWSEPSVYEFVKATLFVGPVVPVAVGATVNMDVDVVPVETEVPLEATEYEVLEASSVSVSFTVHTDPAGMFGNDWDAPLARVNAVVASVVTSVPVPLSNVPLSSYSFVMVAVGIAGSVLSKAGCGLSTSDTVECAASARSVVAGSVLMVSPYFVGSVTVHCE